MTDRSTAGRTGVRLRPTPARLLGYPSTAAARAGAVEETTTGEYAANQLEVNAPKVRRYLIPYLERAGARVVLDAGCGVGASVAPLLEQGYDAYGFDLAENAPRWAALRLPRERLVVVDASRLDLPFEDGTVDFVFSFGVLEHVGTTNGHSDRRPDYRAVREQWLRELFRTVAVGGHLLLGGPNRGFPVDTAHGLDTRASSWEVLLSRALGVSVHKTWGESFLWAFVDVSRCLRGLPCDIYPQSVGDLLDYSRVPAPLKPLVRMYTRHLPEPLLGTGFNPWMMALVRRTG